MPADPYRALLIIDRMKRLVWRLGSGDYPPTIKGNADREIGWDAAIALMIALLQEEDA